MVDYLKAMIRINLIKNNVVTTYNVNLDTKYYSPDIGGIEGKTPRSRTSPLVRNIVEIPDELMEVQQDLIVSMGGLTENSLQLLSIIYHYLYYRTDQYVAKPVAPVYDFLWENWWQAIKEVVWKS